MQRTGSDRAGRARRARTRRRRAAALALLAAAVAAAALAASGGGGGAAVALAYARAWSAARYAAAYALIDPAQRATTSEAAFEAGCRRALVTATATGARILGPAQAGPNRTFLVPTEVRTRLFGVLREPLLVALVERAGRLYVRYSPAILFPGVGADGALHRSTYLPERAAILAREGTPLAEGSRDPALGEGPRFSPLGGAAEAVSGYVGEVAKLPAARREALEAEGVPPTAFVGVSGLELYYDRQLRGTPGGKLWAGARLLASAQAKAGTPLHTTISPTVQREAVEALGGRLGGVIALEPGSGAILGVAGLATDDLQPPGSTFKIITVSAVLEDHLATPQTTFPVRTATVLEGTKLENAGGESCGGTLLEAFAVSCNSVFVPLGVELGAKRLVAMAERFGFNHPPPLPGAVTSTLPPPSQIHGELELGASAIGQGKVLASPLQMALAAATIADGGRQPTPTFLSGQPTRLRTVLKRAVAKEVAQLMRAVVTVGIGGAAAIPGVEVAGKTGTAELGPNPCGAAPEAGGGEGKGEGCKTAERENTDAWFAAFAPLAAPRVAVGVMVVRAGYGGETAAPIARAVIEAALR